jgi:rod shape-determining protein MreD
MAYLLGIPLLSLLTILQSAVISRMPLLEGTPDLILLVLIAWVLQDQVKTGWQWSIIGGLMIGYSSILPLSVPVITYLVITSIVLLLRQKIWENQIIAMFIMTIFGSVFSQAIFAITATLQGSRLPVLEAIRLIILPGLLLNLLLTIPVYIVVKDLAEWIYPEEIKV